MNAGGSRLSAPTPGKLATTAELPVAAPDHMATPAESSGAAPSTFYKRCELLRQQPHVSLQAPESHLQLPQDVCRGCKPVCGCPGDLGRACSESRGSGFLDLRRHQTTAFGRRAPDPSKKFLGKGILETLIAFGTSNDTIGQSPKRECSPLLL